MGIFVLYIYLGSMLLLVFGRLKNVALSIQCTYQSKIKTKVVSSFCSLYFIDRLIIREGHFTCYLAKCQNVQLQALPLRLSLRTALV
jgi:hypothetical protein